MKNKRVLIRLAAQINHGKP
jgi:hypothetical protein